MSSYFLKLNNFPNSIVIDEMKGYAKKYNVPIIQEEGLAFLLFIIEITNAKKILEIGTAIGFSAINMASVSEDILIDTIERDETMYQEAIKNVTSAKKDKQINIYFSDALLLDISKLRDDYDLIFIDAAKAQYINFFTKYEKLLGKNGIIFTDNLLFHGLVNNEKNIESKNLRALVRKIDNYNQWLKDNEKYSTHFFSIGDGIAVSKKNE